MARRTVTRELKLRAIPPMEILRSQAPVSFTASCIEGPEGAMHAVSDREICHISHG
jgi:hypothetical protein